MNTSLSYKWLVVLAALITFAASIYKLDQRHLAVVFQFGEAVTVVKEPGLKFKIPLIQNVEKFEKRLLHVSVEAKELTAMDGKRFVVDAFAKFHIVNPVEFYKKVYNYQGVQIRLNKILESSMRKVIGRIPLTSLLSAERENVMNKISNFVNDEARLFGIEVIDVRILRTDLPKENSAAVYRNMQSEREKEAKQIRAEGEEEAARIKSRADKESNFILSDAYMNTQIIKGEGDAEAAKIYNLAFNIDPDFYLFYKHLETYKSSFGQNDTTLVISPNSPFLKYMNIGR